MKNWINYQQLYYFMTIAESGSVSLAAKSLRLGQPTLSTQLKQLETGLGTLLFERRHKRLILTESGKIAFDYARIIFKTGSDLFEALHDRRKPTKLHVRLGALDSIPKQIMLKLAQSALKTMSCNLTLIEGKFDDLVREVLAHKLDLAITNFFPQNEMTATLKHRRLSKNPVSIYGAAKFKDLKNNFPSSLQSQPIVLPTYDSQLRQGLDRWFFQKKIAMEAIAESQDMALKKIMASSGMALISVTKQAVIQELKSQELFEIGQLKGLYDEMFLISAPRKIENPVAEHLMLTFQI